MCALEKEQNDVKSRMGMNWVRREESVSDKKSKEGFICNIFAARRSV